MRDFSVRTRSGVGPIEAGRGLVHTDTIIATTDDELIADAGAQIEFIVGGKTTRGSISDLGLSAGEYDAELRMDAKSISVKLILVDPSLLCRRFGARYGSLGYDLPVIMGKDATAPWESLWKTGEYADIVVDFEKPYKFVLWRGMAYAPSWAIDNVMTSLFFAETVEPTVYRDCCEMMSDRECRYIHARIIHSSDARVVIHWRYALNDSAYTICRNQWADEVFHIYPSGVAVRNVTVYIDPNDEFAWHVSPRTGRRRPCSMINAPAGKRTFNDMEFITVNPPGATSDDNIPLDALTLLDGKNFSQTFRWPNPPDFENEAFPELGEYIFRMNYGGRPGVFVASPAADLQVRLQPNVGMRYEAGARVQDDCWIAVPGLPTNFADHIHWPVTRGYGTTPLTDLATFDAQPTHTFLGFANNAPVEVRENGAVTWSWFCGIAPESDDELRSVGMAWLDPVEIDGATYNAREGAYVVCGGTESVRLVVSAERGVPHPTFVIEGWDSPSAFVRANGKEVRAALGIERTMGSTRTVVTIMGNVAAGSVVEIGV